MTGILGGTIMKLVGNDNSGAGRLLVSAGRSAIMNAIGGNPLAFGGVAGDLLDLLTRSAAGETASGPPGRRGGDIKESVGVAVKKARGRKAHEKWLANNSWRFDWRSQPRRPAGTDEGGEWMEGRLDHPVAVKYPLSRRVRQQRTKALKAFRSRQKAMGKVNTRTIRTSWGDY